jgi:parallel beta helix pectate lyase-like protein
MHDAMRREYFVSLQGDDSGPGTLTSPWRTLARVGAASLLPGDRVYLKGGETHAGSLSFRADFAAGRDDAVAVRIGSYGDGRARISSGSAGGLLLWNTGGCEIADLEFVGGGLPLNRTSGICLFADRGRAAKTGNVVIRNVNVSGYGCAGIAIGSAGRDGFRNVRIEHAAVHHNGYAGIFSWGGASYSHEGLAIRHTAAAFNAGIPGLLHPAGHGIHSGHGILLTSVDGAIVENCTAHDNGGLNTAHKSGPAGIWASESRRVVIRRCRSFRNQTASSTDGGGFGLDGGVSESLLEDNHSHDNDGPGFLLAQYAYATHAFRGNRVLRNVSERDARRNDNGALHVWGADQATMEDIVIKDNTVRLGPPTEGRPRALLIDAQTRNLSVIGNSFDGGGAALLLQVGPRQRDLVFRANTLATQTGLILWRGEVYKEIPRWLEAVPQ